MFCTMLFEKEKERLESELSRPVYFVNPGQNPDLQFCTQIIFHIHAL